MPESDLPLDLHASFWARFETSYKKEQLPQSLLLSGSLDMQLAILANKISAALLCEASAVGSCGHCQSCHLLNIQEHPDQIQILPEKTHGQIKIDQIRLLKTRVQTYPKLGKRRVIVINPANKMNMNAANALLKILEEPPESCYFILIAEGINTIPATIKSRCQSTLFSMPHAINKNYFAAAQQKAEGNRSLLLAEQAGMVDSLCELQAGQVGASTLASKWSSFDFPNLVWLLYLLHAEMLMYYYGAFAEKTASDAKLSALAQQLQPVLLFAQLDKLHEIIRILGSSGNVNAQLWLETFLMRLCAVA